MFYLEDSLIQVDFLQQYKFDDEKQEVGIEKYTYLY